MDAKRAADYLRDARAGNRELREAEELGAQALEAWAWVERTKAKVARFGEGWAVSYQGTAAGRRMHQCSLGPDALAAVLDAMEKEGKG